MCPLEGELGRSHLTRCRLGRGLPPYQLGTIQPRLLQLYRHGPKIGRGAAVRLSVMELHGSPSKTICCICRALPPYQVASESIQPFGRNSHGLRFIRTPPKHASV